MLNEIEKLNKRIERINTEKTKADAQREVMEKRLTECISDYAKKYGVSLNGKNLKEIKEKLAKEVNLVEAKTKEEYEKASNIVNLIESGDIKGAWKVLGVDIEETEEEVTVEEIKENGLKSAMETMSDLDDDMFFGSGSADVEESKKEDKKPMFSLDDDEDDFISPSVKETKQKDSFVVEDDDEDDTGGFVLEDDEEDDPYGGFGDILKGSKFSIE